MRRWDVPNETLVPREEGCHDFRLRQRTAEGPWGGSNHTHPVGHPVARIPAAGKVDEPMGPPQRPKERQQGGSFTGDQGASMWSGTDDRPFKIRHHSRADYLNGGLGGDQWDFDRLQLRARGKMGKGWVSKNGHCTNRDAMRGRTRGYGITSRGEHGDEGPGDDIGNELPVVDGVGAGRRGRGGE